MPLVCVLGSGIIGLAAASSLVDAGYDIVVVARDLPGDPGGIAWASPSAGAVIYPTAYGNHDHAFEQESYAHFWALANRDPTSGAQILPAVEYFEAQTYRDDAQAWYMKVNPYYRHLDAHELPAGITKAVSVATVAVNPVVYLPWLKKQLEGKGVHFVRFTASSLEQVLQLTQAAILVNASGVGAQKLCNDDSVVPIRGQSMFLRNRPDWSRILLRQGSEYTYVIPRLGSGGVIMGGIRQEGNETAEADPKLREDILRRVNLLSNNAFKDVNLETDVEDIVSYRPGRNGGLRLEIEGANIVHAYGFDGVGYVCCFGAAKRVTELVKELTQEKPKL